MRKFSYNYKLLGEHLSARSDASITLTFDQIESIIGGEMHGEVCASWSQENFWNDGSEDSIYWLKAGYEVASYDYAPYGKGKVRFVRNEAANERVEARKKEDFNGKKKWLKDRALGFIAMAIMVYFGWTWMYNLASSVGDGCRSSALPTSDYGKWMCD